MNLKKGKNHHTYIVKSIQLELSLERRLEALGLLNNDKKGAMTVRFRGTRFALGKHISDHIEVEEAEEWEK